MLLICAPPILLPFINVYTADPTAGAILRILTNQLFAPVIDPAVSSGPGHPHVLRANWRPQVTNGLAVVRETTIEFLWLSCTSARYFWNPRSPASPIFSAPRCGGALPLSEIEKYIRCHISHIRVNTSHKSGLTCSDMLTVLDPILICSKMLWARSHTNSPQPANSSLGRRDHRQNRFVASRESIFPAVSGALASFLM